MPPRDWDAATYDRVSSPQEAMGREVLDRLMLDGGETVLDAGCGTGRVTAALVERLPRGRVIAVDGSPAMVAAARERLGAAADLRVADLVELELEAPVDAVLSTATFHWIADHDRLFARLRAVLRPGGRLVAQCGGAGNVADVEAAIGACAPEFPEVAGWPGPWRFAGARESHDRLEAAGFEAAWAWLTEVVARPDDIRAYLSAVVLGAHLERLAADRRDAFAAAVAGALERPEVRYVRLNLLARRPA